MPQVIIDVVSEEGGEERPINNAKFGGVATNSSKLEAGSYAVTVSEYGTVKVSASGYNTASVHVSSITDAYRVTLSKADGNGNGGNGGWFD